MQSKEELYRALYPLVGLELSECSSITDIQSFYFRVPAIPGFALDVVIGDWKHQSESLRVDTISFCEPMTTTTLIGSPATSGATFKIRD